MSKLFRTFWYDNRIIIGITFLSLFIASIVFPLSFHLITTSSSSSSYYDFFQESTYISMAGYTVFVKAINSYITFPAVIIFITIRTLLGKNRLRYSFVTTSKWTFATFILCVVILCCLALSITGLAALHIVALVLQGDISSIYDVFFLPIGSSLTYLVLSIGEITGILSNIFSALLNLLNLFFFWQFMFLLPQTKMFKAFSNVATVFAIIGIYLGYSLVSFVFSIMVLTNLEFSSTYLLMNHVISVIKILILLATYYYFYVYQLEC
jgi:hypothetical protein